MTHRWREMHSTPRSPVRRLTQTRSNGDVQHPCAAVGHARLTHPTIRDDYRPYPRSVIAGTNACACRDLAGFARSNPQCYAISVKQKWNTAGPAPAIDALLEGLNPAQRRAATYGIGAEAGPVPPLLIAAGGRHRHNPDAGSPG